MKWLGYGERREQWRAGELGHWRTGDIIVRDIEVVGRDIVVGHWGAGEMHTGSSLGVVGWRK